jgi:hypothetical protein
LWALAEEPGLDHAVGRSEEMAGIFFEDILRIRIMHPSTDPVGAARAWRAIVTGEPF